MTRDPRVEPKAGEVFRKGRFTRKFLGWTQMGRLRHAVFQSPSDERKNQLRTLWDDLWFAWAKDAEVIHAAE